MSDYFLTPRARLDLFVIWEFIAVDSPIAADNVIARIESACQMLAKFPTMGHRRNDVADQRYRFWSVYSYLIAYRPDASPIQIMRVVSGHRDFTALFNDNQ